MALRRISHSSSNSRGKPAGPGFFILFGSVFIGAGLLVGGLFYLTTVGAWYVSQSWLELPCVVEKSELVRQSHSSAKKGTTITYGVRATYAYEVDGRQYRSERVMLTKDDETAGGRAEEIAKKLEEHRQSRSPFRCYVNPHRLEEAVLYRDFNWPPALLVCIFPLIFPLVGAGVAFAGLATAVQKLREKRNEAAFPREPWRWRTGWEEEHWLRPKGGGGVWFGAGAALWTCLILLPVAYALGAGTSWSLAGLPVWIAGLLVLVCLMVVRAAGRRVWARLGAGVRLHVEPRPIMPGGEFTAHVALPPRLAGGSRDVVEVQVRCVREFSERGQDGATAGQEPLWVHQEVRPVAEATRQDGHLQVALNLRLPPNLDGDDAEDMIGGRKDKLRNSWLLQVKTSRIKSGVEFDLPVFRTQAGVQAAAAAAAQSQPEREAEAPAPAPAPPLIPGQVFNTDELQAHLMRYQIESRFDDRGLPLSLTCGPGRFASARTFLLYFNAVWTLICLILLMIRDVPLLFSSIFCFGAGGLWWMFIQMLEVRELRFSGSTLEITRRVLTWRRRQTLEKRHVVQFLQDSNMASGSTQYYRVRAETIFNKKEILVDGFTSSVVGENLVAVLERWRKQG